MMIDLLGSRGLQMNLRKIVMIVQAVNKNLNIKPRQVYTALNMVKHETRMTKEIVSCQKINQFFQTWMFQEVIRSDVNTMLLHSSNESRCVNQVSSQIEERTGRKGLMFNGALLTQHGLPDVKYLQTLQYHVLISR